MAKLEAKKERKRNAILKAAQDVFQADGYVGAAMDRIAQQAGVTKQTVYRYYETKEALFQATLEAQRAEGNKKHFLDALELEDTREALTVFAVGFLETHMAEAHLASVRLMVSEGPVAPEMTRAYFAVGPRKTEMRLSAFLQERFHLEDPEYAVKALLAALLSMRMHVLIGLRGLPTGEEVVDHAHRTVAFFMKLMR